jgi:hypothetical protein
MPRPQPADEAAVYHALNRDIASATIDQPIIVTIGQKKN